jgi:type I restriction enzyme S subunit
MSVKIFTIKTSKLEGRLDPYFYLPEFRELEEKLENTGFEIKKLKDVCEINRGGSPRPIHEFLTESENGINWIKIGDTKKIDKYIYSTKEKIKPEGIKYSRLVKSGDFILSNSMSFGKPYIMRTTGCIHDGWLLLRIKNYHETSEEFLYTLLNTDLIYKLFKRVTIGSVVENLSIDLVKEIKIPIPPHQIQNKIVQIMDNAYKLKKEKESESKQLLNSIDDYLLEKLEIKLPEEKKETVFTVNFSDLTGSRFDPLYYSGAISWFLKKFKFDIYSLQNIVLSFESGIGAGKQDQTEDTEKGILQIRPTNINKYGDLKFDKNIYIPKSEKIKVAKYGDVLFNNTNSQELVGKTVYFNLDEEMSFSNHITRIKANKEKINPKYLWSILNLYQTKKVFYNLCTNWNNQSGVGIELLKSLKIPLPPLDIQNEIADHIQSIRDKSKQLQLDADEVLQNSKIEVENLILGN